MAMTIKSPPIKMDLTEIESYLEGVEEKYEEAECKLVEVREGAKDAARILSEVQYALEEMCCVIELVKEELKSEVRNDCSDKEEIDLVIRRLLEAEWRYEELEDALLILPSMSDSGSDSDETGGEFMIVDHESSFTPLAEPSVDWAEGPSEAFARAGGVRAKRRAAERPTGTSFTWNTFLSDLLTIRVFP